MEQHWISSQGVSHERAGLYDGVPTGRLDGDGVFRVKGPGASLLNALPWRPPWRTFAIHIKLQRGGPSGTANGHTQISYWPLCQI